MTTAKDYLESFKLEDKLISQTRYVKNKNYKLSELLDHFLELNQPKKVNCKLCGGSGIYFFSDRVSETCECQK